jgi:Nucleotidyl transferase AbiEii toxin, Type IV TA system
VNDERSYESPAAFRTALTTRLKTAAETSRWTLHELQRQMAYDRLLERLYLVDDGWIVKGAAALIARDIGVRATIDIDVYRDAEREVAEADLHQAAAMDIGDWFRFELGPPQVVADAASGVRLPITAYIGASIWVKFHVDLVGSDITMTGQPERVPPLARIVMPDVEQHGYRAYPLIDHIADKAAAMVELHGAMNVPSTRYKDLVDLVAIVSVVSVEAVAQMAALDSEAERRGITLPAHFTVPDRDLWERGYAAEARRSLLPIAHTLDEALAVCSPFVDPLLDGSAAGTWGAKQHQWA